ncbi:MAG: hypothetical protein ABSG91_16740 [Syntrophobacteraceae bacterium]|jgi:hypothetical protein
MNSHESTGISEADTSYRVVFNGNIPRGRDPESVRRDFIRIFKIDRSRVEDYFSGKPVILKTGLNHQAAASLVETLERAGIPCALESTGPDGTGLAVGSLSESAPGRQSGAAGAATCPKCGHVQREGEECSRCGLIISKYRPGFAADCGASKIVYYDGAIEKKKALLVFLALLLAFILYMEVRATRAITYPPGILIKSEPQMLQISDPKPWEVGKKVIFPLVEFWLQGRVLCSERYDDDALADICPIDIGLGWGPMSDQSIIDQLDFVQSGRKLEYSLADPEHPPSSYGTLWEYVKNVHTIPADEDIKKKVCSVRTGDLIELRGYLVGIRENGQWTQVSSLKKEVGVDHTTCLIFWVTHFKKLNIKGSQVRSIPPS